MLISDSTARALENIAAREREVLSVFRGQPEDEPPEKLPCEPPAGSYFIAAGSAGRSFIRPKAIYFQNGILTDGSGQPILGYKTAGAALSKLDAGRLDSVLGWSAQARIGPDGVVGYERSTIDPLTGERSAQYVSIGRLAVARFPAGTKLAAAGGSFDAAPPGIEPHVGVPGEGAFAPLVFAGPQPIDRELDRGLQSLQEAYLSLDALRAAGAAQGNIQKTAMDLLK